MSRTKSVAFLHTVSPLISTFSALSNEYLPDAGITHSLNESLLNDLVALGPSPSLSRRIVDQLLLAAATGADVVVTTCSSTSPAVDIARKLTETSILKIDDPMADLAVRTGRNIGLICTASSTVEPSSELIRSHGHQHGLEPSIQAFLEREALTALRSGNKEEHDRLVTRATVRLADECDVIVLAQASLSHLQEQLEQKIGKPVLASPRLLMDHLRTII